MNKLHFTFIRYVSVSLVLFPFVVSFLRDWRKWILFGEGRRLSEAEHHTRAQRLREKMGDLGPSFIKGAQVLAMREDIIPAVYADELKQLQDRVPPFPVEQVYDAIFDSLGKSAHDIFDKFDPKPIAAASLGQVHRAVFKGQKVAVKVLRPGVMQLVETDLRVVNFLLLLLDLVIDENLMQSFHAIIDEYERMIHQESDFRYEQTAADRLRKNFQNQPRVRIPHCIDELTSRRTVVFEYIDGVRVDDKEEMLKLGVDTNSFKELLIDTYVRMVVVHGFVHADPHPGNLLVDKQKRLVILDYGMSLEFDNYTKIELLKITQAAVKRDIDRIVEGFYNLGMVNQGVNRAVLRDAANTLLNIQLTQRLSTRQVREIAQEIIQTFYRFPLRMPHNLVYLFRASALVEGICVSYDPMFNGVREATPVVKRMLREIAFGGEKSVPDRIKEAGEQTVITVRELVAVIHRLEREQLRIRVSEVDVNELQRFLRVFLRRLIGGIAFAVVAMAGAAVYLKTGSILVLISSLLIATIGFLSVTLLPMNRGRKLLGTPEEFRYTIK